MFTEKLDLSSTFEIIQGEILLTNYNTSLIKLMTCNKVNDMDTLNTQITIVKHVYQYGEWNIVLTETRFTKLTQRK